MVDITMLTPQIAPAAAAQPIEGSAAGEGVAEGFSTLLAKLQEVEGETAQGPEHSPRPEEEQAEPPQGEPMNLAGLVFQYEAPPELSLARVPEPGRQVEASPAPTAHPAPVEAPEAQASQPPAENALPEELKAAPQTGPVPEEAEAGWTEPGLAEASATEAESVGRKPAPLAQGQVQVPEATAPAAEEAPPKQGTAVPTAQTAEVNPVKDPRSKVPPGMASAAKSEMAAKTETPKTAHQAVPLQASPTGQATATAQTEPPLDTTRPDFAERFAERLEGKADGWTNEFDIALYPRELGKVTVNVQIDEGKAVLTFICENARAQSILNAHAGEIGQLLGQNTGREATLYVAQAGQENEQHNFDGHNGENRGGQNPEKRQQPERRQVEFFIDQLKASLLTG